jgi:hypothetical protein
MRTIKIQATPATERVMTKWLAHPQGGAAATGRRAGAG